MVRPEVTELMTGKHYNKAFAEWKEAFEAKKELLDLNTEDWEGYEHAVEGSFKRAVLERKRVYKS